MRASPVPVVLMCCSALLTLSTVVAASFDNNLCVHAMSWKNALGGYVTGSMKRLEFDSIRELVGILPFVIASAALQAVQMEHRKAKIYGFVDCYTAPCSPLPMGMSTS